MRCLHFFLRILRRFEAEAFRQRFNTHLRHWGTAYLLILLGAAWFQANYAFGLNISPSLPHHLFLIHKGEIPQRGDYVAFRWAGGGAYPAGVTFVKIVAGVPGDVVTRIDRAFFVNGAPVGHAKTLSRNGQPLALGLTGALPADHYYVHASHPDSLDSRYRLTGWISQTQIIGRAYALF